MKNDVLEIAVVKGDGIGPEITEATMEVMEATGLNFKWVETPLGMDAMQKTGNALPLDSLMTIRKLKLAIKAPLIAEKQSGGVIVEDETGVKTYPSVNNGLRRELSTFVNVRPVRGWQDISGKHTDMDIIIFREITEDIYIGIEHQIDANTAEGIKRTTRSACKKIGVYASEYGKKLGRKKITIAHKANVLHLTDGMFLETILGLKSDFPEIEYNDMMIDALCYHVIKDHRPFDMIVLSNQYGDIFSDVTAALAGSLGLAPGANIGDDVSFFEASHGAAPDIAGKGIANPVSLILSGAMLLNQIGQFDAAKRIEKAVEKALAMEKWRTADLGGKSDTKSFTKIICEHL